MSLEVGLLERFEAKFQKGDGCWNWIAGKDAKGYGSFSFNGGTARAPRLAHELYVGAIPIGMHVLHRCDNRACVNPAHLFLGTNADNVADRHQKGRTVIPGFQGEDQPNSRLRDADILAIRNDPRVQAVIAAQYGVNQSVVSRIKHFKAWGHL